MTLVDHVIASLMDHPWIAGIIVIGIVVIGIGAFTDALQKIVGFIQSALPLAKTASPGRVSRPRLGLKEARKSARRRVITISVLAIVAVSILAIAAFTAVDRWLRTEKPEPVIASRSCGCRISPAASP